MLNRIFGKNFHDHLHFFGISVLAVGLPSSKILLSLGTMLILLNILLEGDFKNYWRQIKANNLFIILLLYWGMHIIGLLWSQDLNYAFSDLRIKLTLIVLPLVLTIKPIQSAAQLKLILNLFIAALCLTSLINFASFYNWIGNKTYDNVRELSLFGSHIRYGILISIGAGVTLFYMQTLTSTKKWILLPVFIWFCYYTFFSQIISGLLALIIVSLVFIIFNAFKKGKKIGYVSLALSFVLLLLPLILWIPNFQNSSTVKGSQLESYTSNGNKYKHLFVPGKPPLTYICDKELRSEWKKKSTVPFDSLDERGQVISYTLIRYMSSKDLRKDSTHFQKLTQHDLKNIEQGIASIDETKTGLIARIDGIKFQLYHSGNPNGHSLLQRLEFWKTALKIIKNNWFIGVGTGDVQNAFNAQYIKDNSKLIPENRLRAHNSYLTSWVSFGVFGFILFTGMIILFLRYHLKYCNYMAIMFILVAASTFLIEDTLETQMGVSFFAFFYGLFITRFPDRE